MVSHIYREGNRATDALSKFDSPRYGWFTSPPAFLLDLVNDDILRSFIALICSFDYWRGEGTLSSTRVSPTRVGLPREKKNQETPILKAKITQCHITTAIFRHHRRRRPFPIHPPRHRPFLYPARPLPHHRPCPPPPPSQPTIAFPQPPRLLFHDGQNDEIDTAGATQSPPRPPSIAYFISGSTNDSGRVIRLLRSIYHPKNQYLLYLDRSASQTDRDALAVIVQSVPLFRAAQNVHVIGKADYVFSNGPSALSSTLHGASVLLRVSSNWDWFINLSAADYPLVTQDENTEMFFATQKRPLPDAYRLFTGSSSAVLSRNLIEFCILGTDNIPRTLLMYLSNTPASSSVYFPTVLCNSHRFNRTTINHSLRYVSLDSRQKPRVLNSSNFDELIETGEAFASPFLRDDPILDRIDREILQRKPGKMVPGGWCLGDSSEDKCSVWGDADVLKPGPGAKRLERLFVQILSDGTGSCLDE
ncbi:xylosyltransferase 1 [Phtheirospermum japonicum]|uniref:Xylosyltransferase 1 n=1 Tax=Phtheirospermum japonicum TaxID=374723 RepID=A0A830D376_9LAMI|nr:xylosyltransferase 1 [Phtheirospermum japonicum]